MLRWQRWAAAGVLAAVVVLAYGFAGQAQDQIAQIPGITVVDDHPQGCIDCHQPGSRHSLANEITAMAEEDRHPNTPSDDPASCLRCHASDGRMPLGNLMHTAHLVGGAENHFITHYDGQCMHCHTMDANGSIGAKGF